MKYFELFEIPVQLMVNRNELSGKFFKLSKQFHPDYFAGRPEAEQANALEQLAVLNRAWSIFKDPDSTIKYVLQEKDLLEEEEKYSLPPDFLMEVMDINERMMDNDDTGTMDEVKKLINEMEREIYAPVKKIIENYQEGITSNEELLRVKEYYFKKKYLERIRQQLAGKV